MGCLYPNSYNSYGTYGYINTPSAYSIKESTVGLSFYRGEPDRRTILTGSPFSWLDFSIFYSDITGKPYPPEGVFKQSFKDKGFHAKFNLKKESIFFPEVSLGFNDFGGTGLYSSEYLVFSKRINQNIEISTGIGWGKYSNGIGIKNPFFGISQKFKSRTYGGGQYGGLLSTNSYFAGDSSFFFGGKLRINDNVAILFELDPTQTQESYGIKFPEANEDYNIGINFNFFDIPIKISYERGSLLSANFSLFKNHSNFNKRKFKDINTNSNQNFLRLQEILDKNEIGLKTVSSSNDSIKIVIRQNAFPNQHDSNEIIIKSYESAIKKSTDKKIEVQQDLVGLRLNNIVYESNSENVRNLRRKTSETDLELRHIVKESYPLMSQSFSPGLRTFIAGREGFLYQGLSLDYNFDVAFQENLLLSSTLKYSISDNFDGLYLPPRDTYPNQVRSDIKKYLNNFDRGIIFARIQADYFNQISKDEYFHLSAGILEEMFSGAFFEYLYFPQDSFFGVGFETTYAHKRSYEMKFEHYSYNNIYSRAFLHVREPFSKIAINLSVGEYLAGDQGYTLELNRRLPNGIKMGFFFTRTNVSRSQFGEGAFDKGIRFQIPFSNFLNPFNTNSKESLTKFEWRPLTKDPGQLVLHKERLLDILERYRVY